MLNGYIALITGVTSGIGIATAKKFIEEGATVIGIAKEDKGTENLGEKFNFVQCDVTDEKQIIEVCKSIEAKYEKLDSLVTIADIEYLGNVENVESEVFDEASKHILRAPVLFTKYCMSLLRKSENPSITHDAPVEGFLIEENFLGSIFNNALINYSRQSAASLMGIRVNAACTGVIRSHLLSEEKEAQMSTKEALATIPSGRLGEGKDVASLNCFLASSKARYINSAVITVDGGFYETHPRATVQ